MKKVLWKWYINYEREEKWLNAMAEKGWAMTGYTWCRYEFTKCAPGEYQYRIELLENMAGHSESLKYLDFLSESGIEHVASYMRWIYLRKKAGDTPFDLFSDIDSRIRHYRRVLAFFSSFALLFCASITSTWHRIWEEPRAMECVIGTLLLLMGGAMAYAAAVCAIKAGKLSKERRLRE